MIATVDGKRRVVLPKNARPGDVLDVEEISKGRWVLTKMEKPKAGAGKLIKRYGRTVLSVGGGVDVADIKKVLAEFP